MARRTTPSERRPTISDVARAAGVSTGAVSFALNGRPGVGEDTRERILAAAADLGWTPRHSARALSHSRAYALGLVVARPPELLGADPFFPSFIAGVEEVIAERRFALLLQAVTPGAAEHDSYRRLAAGGTVDGVFLTDLRAEDDRLPLLASLGLPAVTLGRPESPSPFPAVCLDDRPGVAAAVAHLVGLGHRRIAHVAGPAGFLHSRHRAQAWEAALAEAGVRPGPLVEADFTAAGGAAATRALLDAARPPTAVVYANDVMAVAGMAVAAERGLRVPQDLSVTGYDDIELAGHLNPPLTTVRGDPRTWGRAAAAALLALVDGAEPGDTDLPPATFVPRGSTAAAPPPSRTERPR